MDARSELAKVLHGLGIDTVQLLQILREHMEYLSAEIEASWHDRLITKMPMCADEKQDRIQQEIYFIIIKELE
ncbi:MAG: hypothetical protein AAGA64_13085 [Bacteroidota bacterium]